MVQAAHLWKLYYWSLFRSLDRPRNRAVLRQRPMGTSKVVVVEVVLENALEVSFAEDDHLIQAFSADGLDQSFGVRILPRRARRSGLFLDAESRHASDELGTENTIAVAQQVLGRRRRREGVDDLLPGPTRRGSLSDAEMQHLPALVGEHDEDEQHAEGDRRYGEEVDGDELLRVVA